MPNQLRDQVTRQIGEFVVDQVLERVGQGKSPLQGTPTWRKLNPIYAEEQKAGDRTPNLDLTGEMLNGLTYKSDGNSIEVGFFDDAGSDVLGKAEGHNQHLGEGNLPLRRFIPNDNEEFYTPIRNGIKDIIKRSGSRPDQIQFPTGSDTTTAITLNDILGADLFGSLFNGES